MYNILFLFILFASAIDFRISGLNYWDEFFLFAIPFFYILKDRKIKIAKDHLIDIGLILTFTVSGLIGNLLNPGIQDANIAIIKDIIAALKFPLLAIILDRNRSIFRQGRIIYNAARLSHYIIYIMLFVASIGYFINIGVYQDEIRIVKCYRFVFSHPTFMVASLIFMAAMLIADSLQKHKMDLLIISFLLFLSGRTKAYIMIVLLLFLLLVKPSFIKNAFLNFRGKAKVKKSYIIITYIAISLVVYFIAKDKIAEYLSYGLLAARPALYIIGFQLLIKYFPFGSGFGTFASSISGKYYSNIYRTYHIDNVLGISHNNYSYIGDTFLPYIYGQFGVIGTFAYFIFFIRLIRKQISQLYTYNRICSFFILWMYAMIACTSEAFFTNATAVQFVIIMFVFLGRTHQEKRIN